ncbi:C2H2 zinc finger protein [Ectocarpus siliculosus]|uniref:C2H2 zinc finger protein n=1 Tax=Ectocarpus siliculosus TaxID=2880 RepID=D8LT37_ECTSI|nr:C2H2 zinc finger protein [Ectocarpus siliculosus]|eukprot:CBN75311.1 C2H2 zinc finger protein [Ectocarpus siliculosus]
MSQQDKKILLLQLADWNPVRKVKVMKAWEATDPAMTAGFLLELIREEQARGEGPDSLWQCSLCPVKRNVEVEARMKRGEHRRKDRTIDAGSLYDYRVKGSGGGPDTYSSAHESLFEFKQQRHQHLQQDESPWETGGTAGGAGAAEGTKPLGGAQKTRYVEDRAGTASGAGDLASSPAKECLDRSAIISSGHDLELWHTVDHERRALLTGQRRADVLKARWAERERKDRQVSELLRLISEANLDAFSRHSLEDRAMAAQNLQVVDVRRMLDLKLSHSAAVNSGACKDEGLKRLNEREATAWAAKLKLKAALNMDRHYASLEPGGLPASLRRRNPTSSQPSDFLDDGTPATPQGAMQTFGRACPPEDNESGAIRLWKRGAKETEEVLDLRRDVREWQSSCGRRARFSDLCERWVGVASDIEEKQRQKRMIEAAEREKRMRERQAAKLLRKRQLAELRANAGSRATGEERRKVERDKEAEERKRLEGEELERMSREEAAQLAGGDRYWGLIRELQRLRVIEEERRRAWEVRIRATKEKMVAVRCISELSDFTHATPPIDPELQQQIDRLLEI